MKPTHKVDVTRCFHVNSTTKAARIATRNMMVAWLVTHVGPVTKCFADGTATAGEGWKFITRSQINTIECVGLGAGNVAWGQTYVDKTFLAFDDEILALHFKLIWNDEL